MHYNYKVYNEIQLYNGRLNNNLNTVTIVILIFFKYIYLIK